MVFNWIGSDFGGTSEPWRMRNKAWVGGKDGLYQTTSSARSGLKPRSASLGRLMRNPYALGGVAALGGAGYMRHRHNKSINNSNWDRNAYPYGAGITPYAGPGSNNPAY